MRPVRGSGRGLSPPESGRQVGLCRVSVSGCPKLFGLLIGPLSASQDIRSFSHEVGPGTTLRGNNPINCSGYMPGTKKPPLEFCGGFILFGICRGLPPLQDNSHNPKHHGNESNCGDKPILPINHRTPLFCIVRMTLPSCNSLTLLNLPNAHISLQLIQRFHGINI